MLNLPLKSRLPFLFFWLGAIFAPAILIFLFYRDSLLRPSLEELAGIFAIIILAPTFSMLGLRIFLKKQAAETLDPLYKNLNLSASPYLSGRQYHGEWEGKHWDIYINPQHRQRTFGITPSNELAVPVYSGHVLEVYLEYPSRAQWVARTGEEPIDLNPSARTLLKSLLQTRQGIALMTLQSIPGALRLYVRASLEVFTPERNQAWLQLLKKLSKELNPVGPVLNESKWFKISRMNRSKINALLGFGCLGLLLLFFGILILALEYSGAFAVS